GIFGNRIECRDHREILEPGKGLKHGTGFRDEANVSFDVENLPSDVEAGDCGAATRRLEHAGQHFQRGRLPRTIWSEEAHDLAFADVEREIVDGALCAEGFDEVLNRDHFLTVNVAVAVLVGSLSDVAVNVTVAVATAPEPRLSTTGIFCMSENLTAAI